MTTKTRSTLRLALLGIAAVTTFAYVRTGRNPQVKLSRDRGAATAQALQEVAASQVRTTGDLLVDWRDDVDQAVIEKTARELGVTIEPNSRFSDAEKLTRIRGAGARLQELVSRLRGSKDIENVEPDVLYQALPVGDPVEAVATARAVKDASHGKARTAPPARVPAERVGKAPPDDKFPNDPQYKFQWHLDQIGMPEAWNKAQGAGVIVAVLDTGVAFRDRGQFKRVPDLAQTEFVPGYNFVAKNENPGTTTGTVRTWRAPSPSRPTTASAWPAWPTRPASCRSRSSRLTARAAWPTSPTPSAGPPTMAPRSST
jgi:serine protease